MWRFGNYQGVATGERPEVEDGQVVVVLVDADGRGLAGHDGAEDKDIPPRSGYRPPHSAAFPDFLAGHTVPAWRVHANRRHVRDAVTGLLGRATTASHLGSQTRWTVIKASGSTAAIWYACGGVAELEATITEIQLGVRHGATGTVHPVHELGAEHRHVEVDRAAAPSVHRKGVRLVWFGGHVVMEATVRTPLPASIK